jgi:hypothetical protein
MIVNKYTYNIKIITKKADTAINRGVVIVAVDATGGLAHETTTGGNDRR